MCKKGRRLFLRSQCSGCLWFSDVISGDYTHTSGGFTSYRILETNGRNNRRKLLKYITRSVTNFQPIDIIDSDSDVELIDDADNDGTLDDASHLYETEDHALEVETPQPPPLYPQIESGTLGDTPELERPVRYTEALPLPKELENFDMPFVEMQ